MVKEISSPLKDKNYDLIHALQMSLEHVYRIQTYISDAEERGDKELAAWFRKIQENNRKSSEQGKQILIDRLQHENG
ncbi:hypothetical protein MCAG_00346 [Micromonospora sp. ATCC 39149]|uniref:Uncharacterized protein n=1 Tax=Micromonospora carbonacea TaxID=47853 RepID=A0A7D6GAY1_9ACTN|nr:hypothetical protein MCAG_00346 [Micromonospora sp. ATCC 39149]QLK01463.1 hypothetical protein HZU44_15970 [Micromonospora carbonacea]